MKKCFRFVLGIACFAGVLAAGSAIVMLLWNWLVPSVIGWNPVNFWQAAGLIILCKILFAGFHGRHPHGHHFRDRRLSKFQRIHERFHGADQEQMCRNLKNMSRSEKREYIMRRFSEQTPESTAE